MLTKQIEYNITEWDGTIDRVKVSMLWDEKVLGYAVVIEYPDGMKHRITPDDLGRLNPVRIR